MNVFSSNKHNKTTKAVWISEVVYDMKFDSEDNEWSLAD